MWRHLEVNEQAIYGWRRQERIDLGLEPGVSTLERADLAAAKRRTREAVMPDEPNRLPAALTPAPSTGTPPNTLQRLRITGLDNVEIDVGSQTFASPGVDVPIPPNAQHVVLIVRRRSGSGSGTARLMAGDSCGDWQTFVGGGLSAWGGTSGDPGTPKRLLPEGSRAAARNGQHQVRLGTACAFRR